MTDQKPVRSSKKVAIVLAVAAICLFILSGAWQIVLFAIAVVFFGYRG